MTVSTNTLAVAAAFVTALGTRIHAGQIVLKFENGKLLTDGNLKTPNVERLAVGLRDSFGKPTPYEEIALNFNDGVLVKVERHVDYAGGGITTREHFKVGGQKSSCA